MVYSEEVVVRRGLSEFVLGVQAKRGRCAVISVNFSREFIRGVLEASLGTAASGIEIISNVANEDGVICGPGFLDGEVMATSDAKLAAMRKLMRFWDERAVSGGGKTVYFGDSGTDVECLVDEEVVGIVMCDYGKSSLMDALQRVGVQVQRCDEFNEHRRNFIFWASDFLEIQNSRLIYNHSR